MNTNHNEYDEYNKYKKQYIVLKKMDGGGAWNSYSNGNDATQDLLYFNGIQGSDEKNNLIHHTDPAIISKGLKKMFDKFDIEIRKRDPQIKNPDTSIYNVNYAYLGVVIDILLTEGVAIEIKYLKRALVHAYREYIRTYIIREASGWRSYTDRLECLKHEILLINYAINKGTPIDFPKEYISKDGVVVPSVNPFNLKKILITGRHKINEKWLIDNIFLKYEKTKTKVIKVLPLLDPNILDPGTIMEGYYKSNRIEYFIVHLKKDKHVWEQYDPFGDPVSVLLKIEILYDIYGDIITKMIKKDIRKLRKN